MSFEWEIVLNSIKSQISLFALNFLTSLSNFFQMWAFEKTKIYIFLVTSRKLDIFALEPKFPHKLSQQKSNNLPQKISLFNQDSKQRLNDQQFFYDWLKKDTEKD